MLPSNSRQEYIDAKIIALRILQGALIAFIKESLTKARNFMSKETYKDIAERGSFRDTFLKLLEQQCTIPQYIGEITGMSSQQYNYAFNYSWDSRNSEESIEDQDKGSKNRIVLERMKKIITDTPWYELALTGFNPIYAIKVLTFINLLSELQIDNLESLKKTLIELKKFNVVAGGIMGCCLQADELPKHPDLDKFDEQKLTAVLGEYYLPSVSVREVFLWAIAYQKNIFVEAILLAASAANFDLFFLRDALRLSKHCNNFSAIKLLLRSELMQDEKYITSMEMDIKQIFPNNLVNYIYQSTDANADVLKLLVFLQFINPFEAEQQTATTQTQALKEIYSSGQSSFFFFKATQDKESYLSLLNQDTTKEIIMKTLSLSLLTRNR